LWNVARVPGHALENMSTDELRQAVQDVCGAANAPGEHELKIGAHNLSLTIGENHAVAGTETKKPALLGKIGGFLKKALPIVSTVLMFVPGVGTAIGIALKVATAALSAVDAVKSAIKGDWLGMITSAAGAVAGGIASGASGLAGKIKNVASTISRVGRGVESIQQGGIGGIVSGVAGAAGGLSDGFGDSLGNFGESLQTFSKYAQPAGSGFSAAQAAAQGNWAAAFNMGVGATAAVNSWGDGNTLGIGERGMDALQAASRGVNMTDAIRRGDYTAAAATALALAGDLRAAAAGRPENDDVRVDILRRAGEAALAGENLRAALESGDFGDIAAALGGLEQVNVSLQAREGAVAQELAMRAMEQKIIDAAEAALGKLEVHRGLCRDQRLALESSYAELMELLQDDGSPVEDVFAELDRFADALEDVEVLVTPETSSEELETLSRNGEVPDVPPLPGSEAILSQESEEPVIVRHEERPDLSIDDIVTLALVESRALADALGGRALTCIEGARNGNKEYHAEIEQALGREVRSQDELAAIQRFFEGRLQTGNWGPFMATVFNLGYESAKGISERLNIPDGYGWGEGILGLAPLWGDLKTNETTSGASLENAIRTQIGIFSTMSSGKTIADFVGVSNPN